MSRVSELLEEELRAYEAHKPALLARHAGEYVLIYRSEILGIYPDENSAANAGYSQLGKVAFLVRQILPIDEVINIH